MLFNSIHFLLFFPVVVIFYFMIPHRFRWILLLIASYYFYMAWKPVYLILIVVSTLIDYSSAILMEKQKTKKGKKKFLALSLFTNLGLLFAFKYFNFFNDSMSGLFEIFNGGYSVSSLDLLLPVGISFYTFQTLSYTIDVYKGKRKAEKHLGYFAVYVSFFPQLVAGPIERSTTLLPQFFEKHPFDYKKAVFGLQLMLWGFFKKVVIADRVAELVNTVYGSPENYEGFPLIIATVFFSFQIYCDFSGYSDIAIGSAQVMGFSLMKNFDSPYSARSIGEFWKRWHISLSTWFRDYLYIPLGGNRVKIPRYYFNILITFVLSGLWHGANWTFIVWGALNGFYLIYEVSTLNIRDKTASYFKLNKVPLLRTSLQIISTYFLTCFAWIFFRADSLSDSFYIISSSFKDFAMVFESGYLESVITKKNIGLSYFQFRIALVAILMLEMVQFFQRRFSIREFICTKPFVLRWFFYICAVVIVVLFGKFDSREFIYFQF
jgi:alginate O-acetyltransferase complex protein AlgI